MNKNIKYCAVASSSGGGTIKFQECLDTQNLSTYTKEVKKILQSEQRHLIYMDNNLLKKDISSGSLYYKSMMQGEHVVFLLAKPTYSYSRIVQLINEIAKSVKLDSKDEQGQSNIVYELLRQYDANPIDETDSLEKARSTIDSITSSVKGNIENVMKNSTHLNDIEHKSKTLSNSSKGFLEQSKKIEEQLRNRRRRMYYIIGGAIALFILFIFLFVFM